MGARRATTLKLRPLSAAENEGAGPCRLLDQAAARTAQELNLTSLCNLLDLRKETAAVDLDVFSRLGLVHRLGAWTSAGSRSGCELAGVDAKSAESKSMIRRGSMDHERKATVPSRPAFSVLTVLLLHPQVSFSQPGSASLLWFGSHLPAGIDGSAATAAESQVDDLGPVLVLRTFPAEEPFFYSIAAIEQIEAQGVSVFAASMGLPEASVTEVGEAAARRLRRIDGTGHQSAGADANPCLRPIPDQFRDRRTNLRTADEIVNGERLPLVELIRRSPHAVIGEVVEVVPGFHSPLPAALVKVEVVESLLSKETTLTRGVEFTYLSVFFDFELRGRRLCSVNSDFFFPSVGKQALFLLPDKSQLLQISDPYAEFELTDGEVSIHPYAPVALGETRIGLEELMRELNR